MAKWSRRAILATASGTAIGAWAKLALAAPSSGIGPIDATTLGLVGDGVTDDAPALQAAIDDAASRRLPLTIPPGSYGVGTPLRLRTGSIVAGYGATLVTYIPELGDPGEAHPTVMIFDVEHATIFGLRVDGRKDAFPHSQWKHGFAINNSRDILLVHCEANRCKGDGIILSDKNVGDVNIDIVVESCRFGENYRMGGTASGALRATFRNCVFWGTHGTRPMCGFDVEPDRVDVTCQDLVFDRCDFIDNGDAASGIGAGFNVSYIPEAIGPQYGVVLANCTFARNAAQGVDLFRVPRDIRFRNCQVVDNAQDGIRIYADATDIAIDGGMIAANGSHGIHCAAKPEAPCERVDIRQVQIVGNGWSGDEIGNGIHLDHVVDDVRVVGCKVTASSGYGLSVGPMVTGLRVTETTLADNALGETFPASILD